MSRFRCSCSLIPVLEDAAEYLVIDNAHLNSRLPVVIGKLAIGNGEESEICFDQRNIRAQKNLGRENATEV